MLVTPFRGIILKEAANLLLRRVKVDNKEMDLYFAELAKIKRKDNLNRK